MDLVLIPSKKKVISLDVGEPYFDKKIGKHEILKVHFVYDVKTKYHPNRISH
jgi:hypothetical protein